MRLSYLSALICRARTLTGLNWAVSSPPPPVSSLKGSARNSAIESATSSSTSSPSPSTFSSHIFSFQAASTLVN